MRDAGAEERRAGRAVSGGGGGVRCRCGELIRLRDGDWVWIHVEGGSEVCADGLYAAPGAGGGVGSSRGCLHTGRDRSPPPPCGRGRARMAVAAGGSEGGGGGGEDSFPYLKALEKLFQPMREIAELESAPLTGVVGGGRCGISYVWMQCPRMATSRVTAGCIGERVLDIPICDICLEIMRGSGVLCIGCGLAHPLVAERVEPMTEAGDE